MHTNVYDDVGVVVVPSLAFSSTLIAYLLESLPSQRFCRLISLQLPLPPSLEAPLVAHDRRGAEFCLPTFTRSVSGEQSRPLYNGGQLYDWGESTRVQLQYENGREEGRKSVLK